MTSAWLGERFVTTRAHIVGAACHRSSCQHWNRYSAGGNRRARQFRTEARWIDDEVQQAGGPGPEARAWALVNSVNSRHRGVALSVTMVPCWSAGLDCASWEAV